MSPVIVQTSLLVAGFILAEAAIDFLGVGIRPPNVSWGLSLTLAQSAYGSGTGGGPSSGSVPVTDRAVH
jgi:ABC-type dipeptide/oligopeptide/nickel transport system permease subunit